MRAFDVDFERAEEHFRKHPPTLSLTKPRSAKAWRASMSGGVGTKKWREARKRLRRLGFILLDDGGAAVWSMGKFMAYMSWVQDRDEELARKRRKREGDPWVATR